MASPDTPRKTPAEAAAKNQASTLANFDNLTQRAMSGAVLASVSAVMLYLGPVPFIVIVAAIAFLIAWEWGRIVREGEFDTSYWLHIGVIALTTLLLVAGSLSGALLVVLAGAVIAGAIQFGRAAPLSAIGVLYTGLPLVALFWLRRDEPLGFAGVLLVISCVAATDIFAYISGRLIGGVRLWPAISPKKTWSGLIGGIIASAIVGLIFALLKAPGHVIWLCALGMLLGSVSQLGDLAESALKRQFGVKDASDLLPGHGGFMDRMDGIVAATLAAAIIALWIDPFAPARALVYGS